MKIEFKDLDLSPSKEFSLNPTISKMGTSATLATKIKVEAIRERGDHVNNFGLGESPFGGPESVVDSIKKNAWRTSYLPTAGISELRQNISEFYSHYYNYNVDKERVVIGPGSKELLFNTMMVLDASWLFVSPSWVSYVAQAKILNNHYWKVPANFEEDYRITEKSLRKKLNEFDDQLQDKTLAMLLNYPNNPTGLTLSNQEVRRIVRFARNNEIIILSDEIYANITHDDYKDKHLSFGIDYPEGTIVTGGVSKDRSMGGSRFGLAIMPEDQPKFTKAMKSVGSETYTCVSAPIQFGMLDAYNLSEEVDMHMKDCTSIHSIVGKVAYNEFSKSTFRVTKPEGAFYMLPSLNHRREELNNHDIYSSKELVDRLLIDYDIAAINGTAFGLRGEDLSFRIAYIDYNGSEVLKAYRKDPDAAKSDPKEFVENNCPSIIEGLDKFKLFSDDILN